MDMPANAKMQTISGKKYVFIDAPYWNALILFLFFMNSKPNWNLLPACFLSTLYRSLKKNR